MSGLISKSGDIYIKRNRKNVRAKTASVKNHTLTSTFWKPLGVIVSMIILLLGINMLVVAGQHAIQAQTARTITDRTVPPEQPGIMRYLSQNTTTEYHRPYTSPTPTYGYYYNQPFITPYIQPTTVPSADINGLTNQINQINASILSNMQSCIQLSQRAQSQVAQLRANEQQLQATANQIRQQELALNPSDPNTPAARAQLRAQRDQINAQRNQVLSTITQTRRQYNTDKNACTSSVYNQQKTKRTLENQLNNAFRQTTNVRFY